MGKSNPLWVYDAYELVQKDHPTIYAYTRSLGDEKMLISLNFSSQKSTINLKDVKIEATPVLTNEATLSLQNNQCELLPYQAVFLKVNN